MYVSVVDRTSSNGMSSTAAIRDSDGALHLTLFFSSLIHAGIDHSNASVFRFVWAHFLQLSTGACAITSLKKNCAVTSHPNWLNGWVHCSIIQWASRRQFNEFRSLCLSLSFFPIRSCRMQYYSGLNFKWQRTHTDTHRHTLDRWIIALKYLNVEYKTMRTHKNLLSKQIIGINSMHYSSPFGVCSPPPFSTSCSLIHSHRIELDISARRRDVCANLIKTKEKCRLGSVYNSWFNCAAHETKESSAKHLYSEPTVVQRQTAITTK